MQAKACELEHTLRQTLLGLESVAHPHIDRTLRRALAHTIPRPTLSRTELS